MCRIPVGEKPGGATIPVLVVPGAASRQVTVHGDRLAGGRRRLRRMDAPARSGSHLDETFRVPTLLAKGGTSRYELFLLESLCGAETQRILDELITLPPKR